MFEKEITEILESEKEDIKKAVNEQIKQAIITNIKWNLDKFISPIVDEFVKKEIEPEIINVLIESKPVILEQLKNGVVSVCSEIAKTMYTKAESNLKKSYHVSDMLKKLFD